MGEAADRLADVGREQLPLLGCQVGEVFFSERVVTSLDTFDWQAGAVG